MRAILIDPKTRTITEVEYDGNYKSIYRLIDCDTFTVVQIDDINSIFVDDNGLLNNPRYFFIWKGYAQPLANKGLILGCDEEGESIATNLSLGYVERHVRFTELSVQGFKPIPDGVTTGKDHPMGEGVPVIGHTPIFGPPEDEK